MTFYRPFVSRVIMATRLLRLVFPQWQGSGKRKYVYDGAQLLKELLPSGSSYAEVPVSLEDDILLEKGMWGYRQIFDQLASARDMIQKAGPDKILLLGGDCGTEVAPVSYLNKLYDGDLEPDGQGTPGRHPGPAGLVQQRRPGDRPYRRRGRLFREHDPALRRLGRHFPVQCPAHNGLAPEGPRHTKNRKSDDR